MAVDSGSGSALVSKCEPREADSFYFKQTIMSSQTFHTLLASACIIVLCLTQGVAWSTNHQQLVHRRQQKQFGNQHSIRPPSQSHHPENCVGSRSSKCGLSLSPLLSLRELRLRGGSDDSPLLDESGGSEMEVDSDLEEKLVAPTVKAGVKEGAGGPSPSAQTKKVVPAPRSNAFNKPRSVPAAGATAICLHACSAMSGPDKLRC
eukprot:529909-Rhodomonas_salina.6